MNMHPHGNGCGHFCCLRIQNLHVKKGSQNILSNINLHVHCGELVALIGPNGAGKSTLLKTILGQEDYAGVISFSVPGQRNRKAKIGYVPQSPTFDPGDPMSVADLFACCMGKMPVFLGISSAMRKKITECLSRVLPNRMSRARSGSRSAQANPARAPSASCPSVLRCS